VCIVVLDSQRKVFIDSNQSINSQSPSYPSLTHSPSHLLSQLIVTTYNARRCRFSSCLPHSYVPLFSRYGSDLTPSVGGFVLLLLVTLSVPIIKSIHLLVVDFSDGGVRAATIGVFGACYEGIAARSVYSTQSHYMPS
jgi:hypothetical protein